MYPFDLAIHLVTNPTPLGYVGPGPGLSMLGAILALITTLLVCFSAIAFWPIRALCRHWREKRSASQ
jgi:hypothetical protein